MNDTKMLLNYDYPEGYKKLKDLNLIDFEYWYFIPEYQLKNRFIGMSQRYPSRKYIPFARRDDCDDIACFDVDIPDKASAGFEERKSYNNIWEWFKDAIDELINENQI